MHKVFEMGYKFFRLAHRKQLNCFLFTNFDVNLIKFSSHYTLSRYYATKHLKLSRQILAANDIVTQKWASGSSFNVNNERVYKNLVLLLASSVFGFMVAKCAEYENSYTYKRFFRAAQFGNYAELAR